MYVCMYVGVGRYVDICVYISVKTICICIRIPSGMRTSKTFFMWGGCGGSSVSETPRYSEVLSFAGVLNPQTLTPNPEPEESRRTPKHGPKILKSQNPTPKLQKPQQNPQTLAFSQCLVEY